MDDVLKIRLAQMAKEMIANGSPFPEYSYVPSACGCLGKEIRTDPECRCGMQILLHNNRFEIFDYISNNVVPNPEPIREICGVRILPTEYSTTNIKKIRDLFRNCTIPEAADIVVNGLERTLTECSAEIFADSLESRGIQYEYITR